MDPGKLTMNFDPSPVPNISVARGLGDSHAKGVVTVTVKGSTPRSGRGAHEGDPRRWISLHLGQRKYQQQLTLQKGVWQSTFSFLVHNLQQDVVSL